MVTLEVESADSLDVANDGNPEEYQDCEEYRADMVPPPPPPGPPPKKPLVRTRLLALLSLSWRSGAMMIGMRTRR